MSKPSPDRLVEGVIDLWQSGGNAEVSARRLTQLTGIPTSSIYHHFGSLDGLLMVAQESACDAAAAWCRQQRDGLGGSLMDRAAFPSLFASVIDDWTHQARRLAFAWREGQLLAARETHFRPTADRWRKVWASFWQEMCGHFGLADIATLTDRVFEKESLLHMFHWRRVIDRAALDEFCRGWGAWINGQRTPPSPWRDLAKAVAIRERPPPSQRDETASRICTAAARVLGRAGAGGLTHRAVATEAGLGPGAVSHKFHTSADLLHAAFSTIYGQMVGARNGAEFTIPQGDREAAIDALVTLIIRSQNENGRNELFVAVAREPELGTLAGYLRYSRGQTSGRYLQAILGDRVAVSDLDSALFSSFVSGLAQAHAQAAEEVRKDRIRGELDQLITLIEGGAVG